MRNKKNFVILIISIILLICTIIGGFVFYYVSKGAKQIKRKQAFLEYTNSLTDQRNIMVTNLDSLSLALDTSDSFEEVQYALDKYNENLDLFKIFVLENQIPENSTKFSQEIETYIQILEKISKNAENFTNPSSSKEEFDNALKEYNLLIDKLNTQNQKINKLAEDSANLNFK